jgi:hypothetical protein
LPHEWNIQQVRVHGVKTVKLTLALAGTLFLGVALSTAQDVRAQAKPDDARILTELDKGGYIDKLYGGQAK